MKHSRGKEQVAFAIILLAALAGVLYANSHRSGLLETGAPYLGGAEQDTEERKGALFPQRPEQGAERAAYVIDGDTFELQTGERVRLIGIDTPESGEPGFSDARDALVSLIEGRALMLEGDITNKDRYSRLLRYVWADSAGSPQAGDTFVNLEMVRLGLARSYTYPPDVKYQDLFAAAQKEAREAGRGTWDASAAPAQQGPVVVSDFHPDAKGNDNYNLNDEYVTLTNNSPALVNFSGWTLKDAQGNEYRFASFSLASGKTVTLYTGEGRDTSEKLYWGKTERAVWNNTGDTLFLYDAVENLMLEYAY